MIGIIHSNTLAAELTTVCGALVAHIPTVVVPVTKVRPRDADVGRLTLGLLRLAGSLR